MQSAPVVAKLTEDEVLKRLWEHFASQSWATLPQVTVAPGDLDPSAVNIVPLTPADDQGSKDRRIDMLCLRRSRDAARTGPLESLAIEVKVTRADFLSDVRNPDKQAAWREAATRHAYAVPAGLVQAQEVPEGSGLLWIHEPASKWSPGEVTWVRRAPYRPGHRPHLPARVLVAIAWRLSAAEAKVRGWNGTTPSGTVEELRADVLAGERRAERLERDLEVTLGKLEAWQRAYAIAAADGLPCGICTKPVRPLRPGKGWFAGWRHVDKADDEPCRLAEIVLAEEAAKAAYADADTEARERMLRSVHRFGFQADIEAEPWRAWLRSEHSPDTPHPRIDYLPDPA